MVAKGISVTPSPVLGLKHRGWTFLTTRSLVLEQWGVQVYLGVPQSYLVISADGSRMSCVIFVFRPCVLEPVRCCAGWASNSQSGCERWCTPSALLRRR